MAVAVGVEGGLQPEGEDAVLALPPLVEEPLQLEELWAAAHGVVERAAADLAAARRREGKKLIEDLRRSLKIDNVPK